MYHRVAPHAIDPWYLNVTPERFDEQIAVVKKNTQTISLVELADALAARKLPERFCVITFDDGYYNNLQYAKPILAKHGVPATVFVSTGYTGREREFWWEELDDLLLSPETLPNTLELSLQGKTHQWDLGQAAMPYRDPTHRSPDPIRDARLDFYSKVWQPMQMMPEDQLFEALDTLRNWCGWTGRPRDTHRAMTSDELNKLVEGDVIDVGGHTVRHPYLPGLPIEEQRQEILQGKSELEANIGREVSTFSYPFNSHTPDTESIIRESGYAVACSGFERSVWQNDDPVLLPRFAAEEMDGPAFERSLLHWLD